MKALFREGDYLVVRYEDAGTRKAPRTRIFVVEGVVRHSTAQLAHIRAVRGNRPFLAFVKADYPEILHVRNRGPDVTYAQTAVDWRVEPGGEVDLPELLARLPWSP